MIRPTRRDFLSTVGALAGAAAIHPPLAAQGPQAERWDFSWLDRLRGKHRQVFDLHDMEIGLNVVRNWLDAFETIEGLRHPDLNAIVGIGGRAFPVNASHDLYRRYPIGELWQVTDPATSGPALRNVFLEGGRTPAEQGSKVRPLQARGTIFWQCNNALQVVAGRIARATGKPQPEVYADLRAHLNPGVILVPAHTMLLTLVQERGCAYEAL